MSHALPLTHSWPLFEQHQRFDLGSLLDEPGDALLALDRHPELLAARGIGLWECDLSDNRLSWTDGVFDLFGLPRGAALDRDEIAALYAEPSRAAWPSDQGSSVRRGSRTRSGRRRRRRATRARARSR